MKFRHVVGDLRQIAGGARTWLGYFATEDPVGIGLGQLAAESAVATRGRLNRYTVNIANATAEPQDVTLSLDIYPVEAPAHPARHYAFFFKRLEARPRASTGVEIDYDWDTRASFRLAGLWGRPDDLWRGSLEEPTQYALSAVLLDRAGQRVELITIYQRLAP